MASAHPTPNRCIAPSTGFCGTEYVVNPEEMLNYLGYHEKLEIENLVKCYHFACKIMPCEVPWKSYMEVDMKRTIEMIDRFVRHIVYFLKLNESFSSLDVNDQCVLLDRAIWQIFILLKSGSCSFKKVSNSRTPVPTLEIDDAKLLLSPQMFEAYCSFVHDMKPLAIDEYIVMLLVMTVLFSCDVKLVQDKWNVYKSHQKFLQLLKKYLSCKFGHAAGNRVCTNILSKVAMFRRPIKSQTDVRTTLIPFGRCA